MILKDVISELSIIDGPSGSEGAVANRVAEFLKPLMDDVKIDVLGNVIGYKSCWKKGAKRLLLDAHIDEVGFIVTGIEDGFLRVSEIGTPDFRMMPASQVKILTDPPIFGVVSCMPTQILSAEEMNKAIKTEDLSIDIGISDESAKSKVPLGTPVVFYNPCEALGVDSLCGKALDDRAGMAAIIHTMSLLKDEEMNVDLIVMGSAQEELGHRGAITGTFGISPDYAVAVDVTCAKTNDYKKRDAMDFGGGPVIGVGPNMTRELSDKLIAIAKEKGMNYQIEVMDYQLKANDGNIGTNAWEMQVSGEGIATAVVSLPLKYMHSPIETINLGDAKAVSELLAAFILKGGEL